MSQAVQPNQKIAPKSTSYYGKLSNFKSTPMHIMNPDMSHTKKAHLENSARVHLAQINPQNFKA